MRTTALLLTLLTVAATPAMAQFTEFTAFTGNADCNGWSVDATAFYRDGARIIRLEYLVVLSDPDGVEVERVEYADMMEFTGGQSANVTFEGSWTNTPDTGWLVRGDFTLLDINLDLEERDEKSFTATLDCGADPGDTEPDLPRCSQTLRWYRRNPDQWPTDTLVIGGETIDAAGIDGLLRGRIHGCLTRLLARQVIAAKFNLMVNPDAEAEAAVLAADAWLTGNSPWERVLRGRRGMRKAWRQLREMRRLIRPLLRYNHAGCADEPTADKAALDAALLELDVEAEKIGAVDLEDVSFGQLKAMYR